MGGGDTQLHEKDAPTVRGLAFLSLSLQSPLSGSVSITQHHQHEKQLLKNNLQDWEKKVEEGKIIPLSGSIKVNFLDYMNKKAYVWSK